MAAQDIKAIIFDCFGVLYLDATESLSVRFPELRTPLSDLNRQADYGFISRDDYLTGVVELTKLSRDEVVRFIHAEHVLNDELLHVAKEYKQTHKIGLLSNIGRDWIQDFFDEHSLHDTFDAVVVSGDEGVAKPHPYIFQIMADRLGVLPGECVMIDDIEANCAGADAAGMKAIHFVDNAATIADLASLAN